MGAGIFERDDDPADEARSRPAPFLFTDATSILTPNRVVGISRGAFATLALAALVLGPETLGNMGLRFGLAYAVTLFAMLSFPGWSIRTIAGWLTLGFAMRWALGAFSGGTVQMLAVQLAGIVCTLVPIYARNVARLAGVTEGHISFTERRQLWQREEKQSSNRPRRTATRNRTVAALADLRGRSD